VCRQPKCQKRGGQQLIAALQQALHDGHAHRKLQSQVKVQYTGCQKQCSDAPTLTIFPGNHRYSRVKPARLLAILQRHLAETDPNA
jgi:NADH:ubiquinone oxidoreductase subunit E